MAYRCVAYFLWISPEPLVVARRRSDMAAMAKPQRGRRGRLAPLIWQWKRWDPSYPKTDVMNILDVMICYVYSHVFPKIWYTIIGTLNHPDGTHFKFLKIFYSGFGSEHCRHLHVFCKLSISFCLNFCVQLSCKFSSLATSSDLMIFFPAHLKSFKQLWHCPFAWSAQRRRNDFYYQAPKQPISSICEAIWYISPRNLTMFLARCEGFYKWGVPLNHPF